MKIREALLVLAIPVIAASLWNASCNGGGPSDTFTENVSITVCDPSGGPFTLGIDNPFFPLEVGTQLILEGDEGGTAIRLEVTVLDETEDVAGVTTRVLEERETHDGELVEVSRNFFVQAPDGIVCYFGEDVDIYEGGVIVSHEGNWRAGVDGALPGIFMPASPAVGQAFRQEVAPGVAEDRVEIEATGESVTTQAGTFTDTVRFLETTPLEPGATSTKVFARDVGLIVDDVVRLTE
jgi:hypothetical protein